MIASSVDIMNNGRIRNDGNSGITSGYLSMLSENGYTVITYGVSHMPELSISVAFGYFSL
jgi:hypothetical protein